MTLNDIKISNFFLAPDKRDICFFEVTNSQLHFVALLE